MDTELILCNKRYMITQLYIVGNRSELITFLAIPGIGVIYEHFTRTFKKV